MFSLYILLLKELAFSDLEENKMHHFLFYIFSYDLLAALFFHRYFASKSPLPHPTQPRPLALYQLL